MSDSRDLYADMLKLFLMWLVVLGHFIQSYQNNPGPVAGLYHWIYTFHMPLFVFLSGYFSKSFNYRRKNIDTLLYPFVVFQLLNIVYSVVIPIQPLKDNFFYPYHQNWYLIALFWWRSFSPYNRFFKNYFVAVFVVLFCLGVGFFPEWSNFLGLYKTAYFLPFFFLGTHCDDLASFSDRLIKHWWLWLLIFIVIIVTVLLVSLDGSLLKVLNYSIKAEEGYGGEWRNLLFRAGSLLLSFFSCLSVLTLTRIFYKVIKHRLSETAMGGGTILCFLCHEFFLIPLLGVYSHFGYAIGFLLCFFTSILLTWFLTRKVIVDFFSPILDLNVLCEKMKLPLYK